MKNIIYGLSDPRNDVYYYIGKSTVGNDRALQHLLKSHNQMVNEWVEELKKEWLYPNVYIIEEVDDINMLPEREKHWINYYYNINPTLFNIMPIKKTLENQRTSDDEEKFNELTRIIFDIPNIVKKERLARKLTQGDISRLIGISRSTISLLEKGENVTIDVIKKYLLELKGFDIKTNLIGKRCRVA
jgi:DNA-binding XRE family transcriptional regulator